MHHSFFLNFKINVKHFSTLTSYIFWSTEPILIILFVTEMYFQAH